jgi:hypothetical protein
VHIIVITGLLFFPCLPLTRSSYFSKQEKGRCPDPRHILGLVSITSPKPTTGPKVSMGSTKMYLDTTKVQTHIGWAKGQSAGKKKQAIHCTQTSCYSLCVYSLHGMKHKPDSEVLFNVKNWPNEEALGTLLICPYSSNGIYFLW